MQKIRQKDKQDYCQRRTETQYCVKSSFRVFVFRLMFFAGIENIRPTNLSRLLESEGISRTSIHHIEFARIGGADILCDKDKEIPIKYPGVNALKRIEVLSHRPKTKWAS